MDERAQRALLERQSRWGNLVVLLKDKYPDILHVQTWEEWDRFRAIHPELSLERNAYYQSPSAKETGRSSSQSGGLSGQPAAGSHGGGTAVPLALLGLLLRPKPEILEQDKKYQKIEKELKEQWQKKNPGVDPNSKEGLDYLHGSLDDPNAPTLQKDAEARFRELHPKEAAKYDKKKLTVYRNIEHDAAVTFTEKQIEEHTNKRFTLAKKTDPNVKIDDIHKQVAQKSWREFALRYKEKAETYGDKHEDIKHAIETLNAPQPAIQKAAAMAKTGNLTAAAPSSPPVPASTVHITPSPPMLTTQPYLSQQDLIQLDRLLQQPPPGAPVQSAPFPQPQSQPPQQSPALAAAPPSRTPHRSPIPPLGNPRQLASTARSLASLATKTNPWVFAIIAGVVLLLLLFVFFLVISGGGALFTLTGGENPPNAPAMGPVGGAGCPSQEAISQNRTDRNTCRLLNPSINIFDTTISPDAVESYIAKYSPIFVRAGKGNITDFRTRVTYLVTRSKEAGLNPAIFLGYWKTESLFSTIGQRDMGCIGEGFNQQVDCAMGLRGPGSFRGALCAISKDAASPSCTELKGIRNNPLYRNYPISYPIKTFDGFAETYGPIAPNLEGNGVNNNCIATYNSLLEVANELGVCRATAPVAGGAHPTAPAIVDDQLERAIKNTFHVDMVGFGPQAMRWAWEKLWDVSNTKFTEYVKGATIIAHTGSFQHSCKRVYLQPFPAEELFKVVFTHELGHIIRHCTQEGDRLAGELSSVEVAEGNLTKYSQDTRTCIGPGTDNFNEDYAEMIAYYLNPHAASQTVRCALGDPNPYANGAHLLHYNLAKKILGEY